MTQNRALPVNLNRSSVGSSELDATPFHASRDSPLWSAPPALSRPRASPVLRACAAFAGACLLAFHEPVRVGSLDTVRLERRPLPPPEAPLPCGARFPAAFVELLFLTPPPR